MVTHDDLPTVIADPSQFVQLFQNLIGNALKFCDGTPRVHVAAERTGEEWHFSVRDNGIGIAPEYRERIFEIFQRLHARDKYPGTGIGLAICKRWWSATAAGSGSSRGRARGAPSSSPSRSSEANPHDCGKDVG